MNHSKTARAASRKEQGIAAPAAIVSAAKELSSAIMVYPKRMQRQAGNESETFQAWDVCAAVFIFMNRNVSIFCFSEAFGTKTPHRDTEINSANIV